MKISSYQMQWRGMQTLYNQQSQISELQEKISKGKNFLQPGDDPYAATRSLQLRQYISRVDQYNDNANQVKLQLDMTEQSLSSYQDILTRLNDLTLQIANDTYNDKDLNIVQQEVKELLNSALALANTKDAFGRSIFSGFTQGVDPVKKNQEGTFEYFGDLGRRMASIGSSTMVPQNKLAQEIFFGLKSSHAQVQGTEEIFSKTLVPDLAQLPLEINGQNITLYSDNTSFIDDNLSAIAWQRALEAAPDLEIDTRIEPVEISLGKFISGIPAVLSAGDLTINGEQILGPINTLEQFQALINDAQSLTGVQALVDPISKEMTLQAEDGRNVHIQYNQTGSNLVFEDFFNAGPVNTNFKAQITLNAQQPFELSYNSVLQTLDTQAPTFQVDTTLVNSSLINEDLQWDIIGNPDQSITIISAQSGEVLAENISPSESITLEGVTLNITGPVNTGTVRLQVEKEYSHDIFNAMNQFIEFLGEPGAHEKRDEVRLMLETIDSGFSRANQAIAEIGASVNLVDRQVDINKEMMLQSQQVLSSIEDLDLTKAISDFSFQKIAIEAAQSSYMQMQGLFLFKYM